MLKTRSHFIRKKNVLIIVAIFLSFLLTSCVDYVQDVSYKNGKYQMYCKVTLSKLFFAMMNEDLKKIDGGG